MEDLNVTVEAVDNASKLNKAVSYWLASLTIWVTLATTFAQTHAADFGSGSILTSAQLDLWSSSIVAWTVMVVTTIAWAWGFLIQKYFGKKIIHVVEKIFTR